MDWITYFPIDPYSTIYIRVPNKEGSNGQPHKDDFAIAEYYDDTTHIILQEEELHEVVHSLYVILERTIHTAFTFPSSISTGELGYVKNLIDNTIFSIWYTVFAQTLLYTIDSTAYLEIVPVPFGYFQSPHYQKIRKKLMFNYKPYTCKQMPQTMLTTWRDTSYHVLSSLLEQSEMPSRKYIFEADKYDVPQ